MDHASDTEVKAAFKSWVARSGLLSSRKGGFGIIGTASLKKHPRQAIWSGPRWSVEVCVPSNHGYPGGFGYDYPVSISGTERIIEFLGGTYEVQVSLAPHPTFRAAPCVVGTDCCEKVAS